MGTLAKPGLAAAVANAGGLGLVSVYGVSAETVAALLDEATAATQGTLGANFIRTSFAEAAECVAIAAQRVRVVDFFYFDPEPALVDIVHQHGALACWQVGSVEEARAAAEAGCDFIVAQGNEAGGHVRGTIGLLPLLDAVLDGVNIPVLAAGGIGSGRSMAAALAAGADGVRIGTRFVAAQEAEAHPDYVRALIAARPEDTVYTEAYSTNWPDAPHRVLRSCIDAATTLEADAVIGEFDWYGQPTPVRRFDCLAIDKTTMGTIAAMPHWAGESVGDVTRIQPAAAIVEELVEVAEQQLARW